MTDTLLDMASEKKSPETENARISREIMRKVRVVAARRGMTTPEYLNAVLGPLVEADHDAETIAMNKERMAKAKRKPD